MNTVRIRSFRTGTGFIVTLKAINHEPQSYNSGNHPHRIPRLPACPGLPDGHCHAQLRLFLHRPGRRMAMRFGERPFVDQYHRQHHACSSAIIRNDLFLLAVAPEG